MLKWISSIENHAERLVVGIVMAAGAKEADAIKTVIHSMYPTYRLGWVHPWDPELIADWFAREAKKRRIPFNSETTIRRKGRLRVTSTITRPAWRIAKGSTLSGGGESTRVNDLFIFEDGAFTPCERESPVYAGANFSAYGLRVAGEILRTDQ